MHLSTDLPACLSHRAPSSSPHLHRVRPRAATKSAGGAAVNTEAPSKEGATSQSAEAPRLPEKESRAGGGKAKPKAAKPKGFPGDVKCKTSGEAISAGVAKLHDEKKPREALKLFEEALDLPGNGFVRLSGTVRERRCASEAEEYSALYNMACCYAALGEAEPALTCLQGALDAGLPNTTLDGAPADPDLAPIKGSVEGFIRKHRFKKALPFGLGNRL